MGLRVTAQPSERLRCPGCGHHLGLIHRRIPGSEHGGQSGVGVGIDEARHDEPALEVIRSHAALHPADPIGGARFADVDDAIALHDERRCPRASHVLGKNPRVHEREARGLGSLHCGDVESHYPCDSNDCPSTVRLKYMGHERSLLWIPSRLRRLGRCHTPTAEARWLVTPAECAPRHESGQSCGRYEHPTLSYTDASSHLARLGPCLWMTPDRRMIAIPRTIAPHRTGLQSSRPAIGEGAFFQNTLDRYYEQRYGNGSLTDHWL